MSAPTTTPVKEVSNEGSDAPPLPIANGEPFGAKPSRSHNFSQQHDPETVRRQIADETSNISWRSGAHEWAANRWDSIASWTRVTLSLTAGVSAVAVVADNTTWATVFALITAGATALNAGFSPAETAKRHRDTARAYGHLVRPLWQQIYKLDSYYEYKFVPSGGQTVYDKASNSYRDSGRYELTKPEEIPPEDLKEVWDAFLKIEERVEPIDDSAPPLKISQWRLRQWDKRAREAERSWEAAEAPAQ